MFEWLAEMAAQALPFPRAGEKSSVLGLAASAVKAAGEGEKIEATTTMDPEKVFH